MARPAARRCTSPARSAGGPRSHALLVGAGEVETVVLVYLNRLSDLLFVMARAANHRAGVPETIW